MDVKLPIDISNIGVVPLSQSEALLLGGFTEDERNMNYKMKFSVGTTSNIELSLCDVTLDTFNERLEYGDFF